MSSINTLLDDAPAGRHFCQLHRTPDTLNTALFTYAANGFARGDALIVFAAPERLHALRRHIVNSGRDVAALESSSQLHLRNGGDVLDRFVRCAQPDWTGFRHAIDSTVKSVRAKGWQRLRAYGDMVNDLWRALNTAEAIRLEQLWNDVRRDHDFCLFCGYELDGLDAGAYAGPIRDIARVHTETPATTEDMAALDALDRASRDVIGFPLADMVGHSVATTDNGERELPLARQIVLWLRRNMPSSADAILARARFHYQRSTGRSTGHSD